MSSEEGEDKKGEGGEGDDKYPYGVSTAKKLCISSDRGQRYFEGTFSNSLTAL